MATECSSARHCQQPDLPVPIAVDSSLRPTGRFKHTCINCLRGIHGPCGEDFDLLQLRKLDKAKLNKAARETTVFTNNDQICFSCIETCSRVIEDGDQGAPRSRPKRNAQPNVRIGSPQAAASKNNLSLPLNHKVGRMRHHPRRILRHHRQVRSPNPQYSAKIMMMILSSPSVQPM